MNRLGRAIAAIAVLCVAAVSVVAATNSPAVGKDTAIALPQYVEGYWPDEPQLCIVDRTDGMPVAEAVAQYEATNVDMVMGDGCTAGAVEVKVMAVPLLWCKGPNGCHRRGPDSVRDDQDLWVHSAGAEITLSTERDLTDQQWLGVVVHEFGHLVGLSHTNRRDSVMRRGSEGAANNGHHELTETDIAVINELYP